MPTWRQPAAPLLPTFIGLGLSGCDPVIDLEGAFFPSWMLCLLAGVVGAALLRPLFARSGLEPHLGPLPLIYSCLALLLSFATWLLFFPT
ncbi:MAG: YtcA family lipoprotein [bacterium]